MGEGFRKMGLEDRGSGTGHTAIRAPKNQHTENKQSLNDATVLALPFQGSLQMSTVDPASFFVVRIN